MDVNPTFDDDEDPPITVRLPGSPPAAGDLAIAEAHLVVVDGPGAGREVPCGTRAVRIGSAPDNELVLNDPSVSRHHARLEPQGGRFLLEDKGSTNGTFLGDVQVQQGLVQPGAFIRMGSSTLHLQIKRRDVAVPPSQEESFGVLVGRSTKMRQLFTVLGWVAPTHVTVLVTGPTGTGKEMVARSLHLGSPRASGPFVVLDCGAVDASLISSELFGHEAGAFTGAVGRRRGVFEEANGGTVFLDEVGELPLNLQPKLLRVLETREIKRVGGNAVIPVDVRVVAATNRNLEQMIARHEFREDLYYRLGQVKVQLPSLDDRPEDIPLLAHRFLNAVAHSSPARTIAPELVNQLANYTYPGNVRQLKNVVERMALVAREEQLDLKHLAIFNQELEVARARAPQALPTGTGKRDERREVLAALEANDFNLVRTAQVLGIARNTLKARMEKYGIARPNAPTPDPDGEP